ncbi:histidine phosphatase family protein [Streptomyces coeruleoprunus]|uniref:Histidine phosphatase family protein n=1 Tax=Streptomyces coeruleoprunus TaxID=285563 RepID=A0ABV9XDX8_9ACTN
MTVRLTLLAAAPGPAGRAVRFGDDGPLDERALRRTREVVVPAAGLVYTAPSVRCRATAAALGREGARVEEALRDLDPGLWRGRTLDEVAADDPAALAAWTTDPAAAPPGGEPVTALCARVADWLDGLPGDAGRVLAVTGPAVVRAAVLHAVGAPPGAFWRIDVEPLSATGLSGRAGRWNLRLA